MPDTGQEKGKYFYRTFLIAAVLAAIGATIVIGMLYGCERQANPKQPRQPSTGIALVVSNSSKNHSAASPWHFLYFLPDPQGHGSLRPTLA